MTYVVAALVAIPITLFGIIAILEARAQFKRIMQSIQERGTAEMADVGPAPVPDSVDEIRFTQSLLALSKVRSPELDGFPKHEPAESSSLALIRRAQSRIPGRVA